MKTWKKKLIKHALVACAVVLILVMGLAAGDYAVREFYQESNVTATVKSIEERLVGGSTTCYIITDKGTFRIEPEGFNACPEYGLIEVGKTYNMTVRRSNLPIFGRCARIIIKVEKK